MLFVLFETMKRQMLAKSVMENGTIVVENRKNIASPKKNNDFDKNIILKGYVKLEPIICYLQFRISNIQHLQNTTQHIQPLPNSLQLTSDDSLS